MGLVSYYKSLCSYYSRDIVKLCGLPWVFVCLFGGINYSHNGIKKANILVLEKEQSNIEYAEHMQTYVCYVILLIRH